MTKKSKNIVTICLVPGLSSGEKSKLKMVSIYLEPQKCPALLARYCLFPGERFGLVVAAHAADVIAHISRPRDLDRARNKVSKRGSHPTYVVTAEGTWAVSAVFITSTVFCFQVRFQIYKPTRWERQILGRNDVARELSSMQQFVL